MINLKVNKNLMKTSKLVLTLVDFVVFKKEIKILCYILKL